jgi:hypothetical protein
MAASRYPGDMSTASARGGIAVDISGADHEFSRATRGIYVGVAGNLHVRMADGSDVTFTNVAVGIFPIAVDIIHDDSTADEMVALF